MNNKLVVLYVEDEVDIREEMYEILSLDFKNIIMAENGHIGLEMYKKHKPDLVISDLKMPFMDGIEMSKKMLEIDTNAKIILTTAFNEVSYIETAKEIGIKGYIKKPISIDDLFKTISNILPEEENE